jgi:hypothetical protein
VNLPISLEESKVLFALLDAAEEAGMIRDAGFQQRWLEAKVAVISAPMYEGGPLWELLETLERSGAMNDTWIEARWSMIKQQVQKSVEEIRGHRPALSSHTPPFFARHFRRS